MVHQSVSKADATMMQRKEAVIVTCMIIALTAIRAEEALTAEALRVQVAHQTRRTVVLLMKRAAILLQVARRHIHPAAVLQRKVTAPWILMMKAIMLSMKMVIAIGIAIGAMMIMLPVWMMQWRTMTGIGKEKEPGNAYDEIRRNRKDWICGK